MPSSSPRISILDRANTRAGSSDAEALAAVVVRGQQAEQLGYHRFWVAEHHGVPGIAGSAPAILMAALAGRTTTIRVGSGGIMLPNHQPLVVAEQAATLAALFPGRVDLGLGRSLGFTPAVRNALGAGAEEAAEFAADINQVLGYLAGTANITSRPALTTDLPVFILATSTGIDVAAKAGLGVVLGGPALTTTDAEGKIPALERYRKNFQPSQFLAAPTVMVSINVGVADTAGAARKLVLPEAVALARSRSTGSFAPLAPVDETDLQAFTASERQRIETNLAATVHGTPGQVKSRIEDLLKLTGAAELLVTGGMFDVGAQDRSDVLLAGLWR